jgi:hypothetical protein
MAITYVGMDLELAARAQGMIGEHADKYHMSEGVRTYAEQKAFYDAAVKKYGEAHATEWAAYPGTSNHEPRPPANLGEAIDIWCAPKHTADRAIDGRRWGLHQPLDNEGWHFELSPKRGPMPITHTSKEDDMAVFFQADCPSGGYWLCKPSDGGVFGYEGAPFFGSLAGARLAAPIVAMCPYLAAGEVRGYWLLGADGGVFALGGAPFTDSYAGHPEWHNGARFATGIEQNGEGYNLIFVEVGSDPPRINKYDLSVKR